MPNTDNDRLAVTLKFEKLESGDGRARVSAKVEEPFMNGVDIAHGGFLFALADYAVALASNTENRVAITSSANMNFISPAPLGAKLIAETKIVAETPKSGVYGTIIRDSETGNVYSTLESRIVYKKA